MMKNKSLAFVPSNMTTIMTNDIPYTYRQNSNFYYLTGFIEPCSLLVIEKSQQGEVKYSLFVRPNDAHKELWDGPRCGVEKSSEIFGFINHTFSIEEFTKSDFLFKDFDALYFDTEASLEINQKIQTAFSQQGVKIPKEMYKNQDIINHLRCFKSENEIKIFKKVCDISAEAFISAMKCTKPGVSELHIEAILEFESRIRGAQRLAYPPVVATGNNGNIMHYVQNTQILKDGDLLLVDAAAEYHNYPCDITRTWPVNGKFSPNQRKVYEAVLRIQKACIELCKPGMTFSKIQDFTVEKMKEELIKIGVCNRFNVGKLVGEIYPHNIGHPMGMDIHEEEPSYNSQFKPGMIVTIEPGIYLSNANKLIPEEFKGIAVRIEDDVLITENGHEVLTKNTPKEIEDIEELMKDKTQLSKHVSDHMKV